MNELVEIIGRNTLPSLINRSYQNYVNTIEGNVDGNVDTIEPMNGKSSSGAAGGFILSFCLSSLLLSFIGIYSQYILVKCYCSDFLGYIFGLFMLMTFPYLAVPFLFYKRFSSGSCKDIFGKL